MPANNTGQKAFWRRPMRVMDLALEDSHGSWVNRWTPDQVVEIAVGMNANVLNMMVVNEWGQAYWPSSYLPMQPELPGEDRFRAVAERAQQAGLHLSRMWGPTAAPCQFQRHPDWAVRLRDGTRVGWGEKESENCFHVCMNSPFEDQVNEVADELFRNYPIEMLALDFYYQEPCWYEFCRQRCLADTGFDIYGKRAPYGRGNIHQQWQKRRADAQTMRLKETIEAYGGALVTSLIVPGVDVIFHEPHTGDMLDLRDKGFMIRLVNAVTWGSPVPPILAEAPSTIKVTYWHLDGGGYLLHLMNHTHDAMFSSPASGTKVPASRDVFRAITQVIPVRHIKIHLTAKPASAEVLIGDAEVTIDATQVTLGNWMNTR